MQLTKATAATTDPVQRGPRRAEVLNTHELHNLMRVFALPSSREGMSNTLLEAMASGLPCIATAVGNNREPVADREWGLLFNPGEVVGSARRLEQLAQQHELRMTFAVAARQQAVVFYGLDRILTAYAELYSEMAQACGLSARN